MTYEYNSVIPSDLSSYMILMIGRGQAKKKRFKIGIQAMQYIIKVINDCELNIISDFTRVNHLINLINNLNLNKNIKFVGFEKNPEIYFKNSSLNLFPSISEAFPMVIIETKLFGIPNILIGLDYLAISNGGNIIIYDDTPELLAKEAIIILKNNIYRKQLGMEAKKSMKKYNNEFLIIKWIELIISIYSGDYYYQQLREKNPKLNFNKTRNIVNNQIKLFKTRVPILFNISVNEYENFSFMESLNL